MFILSRIADAIVAGPVGRAIDRGIEQAMEEINAHNDSIHAADDAAGALRMEIR